MSVPQEKFQSIYKGRDFYVPAFDIRIAGVEMPKATARDITEVRYNDYIDKVDTMEFTLNNWDAQKLDFKYTGSKYGGRDALAELFNPGQIIELYMGYFKPVAGAQASKDKPDPLRLMLAGKIHKLAPTFPSDGSSTLKVSAQSILSQLSDKQETHHYAPDKWSPKLDKMTASLIARKVGKRGKLKFGGRVLDLEIDENAAGKEPKLDYVLQDNQFDIVFLLQLAHRHSYDVVLLYKDEAKRENPYLFFGPVSKETPVSYTLKWGESLIQFQPTLSTAKQVMQVTVRGWNAATKKEIKVTVDRTMIPNSPLKDKKQLEKLEEGFKEKEEIIVDKPFADEKQAKEYAMAQLTSIAGGMVKAHGSTIGTPDLRAGSRISVEGLGSTFSGTYTVTASTHVIGSSGYVTEFDARLEEKNG